MFIDFYSFLYDYIKVNDLFEMYSYLIFVFNINLWKNMYLTFIHDNGVYLKYSFIIE